MIHIKVDTRKTVVRPMHAKSLTKVFELLKTDKGKQIIRSGWKGAGIIKAVHDARNINTAADLADPFSRL